MTTARLAQSPCLCGCGRVFARPKSLPLCKAANARAWAICRALPLEDEFNAEARRNARFWKSAEVVAAALLRSANIAPFGHDVAAGVA